MSHTFPHAGRYTVTATATDITNGLSRSWSQTVVIDPAFSVTAKATKSGSKTKLSATASGGQGTVVAWSWTCANGSVVYGRKATCPAAGAGKPTVTAVDGGGNVAVKSVG